MVTALACLALCAALALPAGAGAGASAAADQQEMLIYMPYGLVHSLRPVSQVDGYLAEVDSYDIGQVLFAMPNFRPAGTLKLPRHNREMLTLWSAAAAAYDGEHGAHVTITAVFNGKPNPRKNALDLEDTATRANMVAAVQATLATGVGGVQLDIEPFPSTPGFLSLLEELDSMFARVGFHGRLSVVAPSNTSRWTPSFTEAVSQRVAQIDPTFYDSEYRGAAAYEAWVQSGLAYYTANTDSSTRIVPVLPSYSANRWHLPSVENIETATAAVSQALSAGSRVNGAGIWWGYGFLFDEEGAYDAAADRAAWQASTVGLPFTP